MVAPSTEKWKIAMLLKLVSSTPFEFFSIALQISSWPRAWLWNDTVLMPPTTVVVCVSSVPRGFPSPETYGKPPSSSVTFTVAPTGIWSGCEPSPSGSHGTSASALVTILQAPAEPAWAMTVTRKKWVPYPPPSTKPNAPSKVNCWPASASLPGVRNLQTFRVAVIVVLTKCTCTSPERRS